MLGATIFLVEDEGLIRLTLADMIEEFGHRVVEHESCRTGLGRLGAVKRRRTILREME